MKTVVSMTRRTLCRALSVAPALAAMRPTNQTYAADPTPTPKAATKEYVEDYLPPSVFSPTQSLLRRYEFPEGGIFVPTIYWVNGIALIFSKADHAIPYGTAFAEAFRQWTMSQYADDPTYSVSELRPASSRALGEESLAWVFDVENDTYTYERGIFIVRAGTWLQLFTGATWQQSSIHVLADLAETTEGRWPNSTATSRNGTRGLHSGGAWEMLPKVEDLPEGASVESEGDAYLSD